MRRWRAYDWRSWTWWPRWLWTVIAAETLLLLYVTTAFRASPGHFRLPMQAPVRALFLGEAGFVSSLLWINLWIVVALWVSARLELNVRNERGITLVVLPPALVLLAISVLIWQFATAWWIDPVDTVIERQPDGRYGIVAQDEHSAVGGLHEWVDSLNSR